MKIGFYITNKTISSVDCSSFKDGNPGVGGSEFAMFGVLDFLCSIQNSSHDFVLYINENQKLPSSIKNVKIVKDFKESIKVAINDNIDVLVLKHSPDYIKKGFFEGAKESKLKFVIWAHNFLVRSSLNYYGKTKEIVKIVNVSFEQLDVYRDHIAYKKSTAIYNGLYSEYLNSEIEFNKRKNEVTYIGSIIPAKGFHVLAKCWKKIIISYPDAILNVIGSGTLYDRNQLLGEYGIAEESYEKNFIKYLIDKEGKVLNSVIFHGVLGKEKNDILKRTKVGVPNPSGKTETFGYTAVEMQCFGSLVTTKKSIGYNETVYDKANLYEKEDDLENKIINLMSVTEYNAVVVKKFIKTKFDFKEISSSWLALFDRINFDKEEFISEVYIKSVKTKLIEFNRKIKNSIPFGYFILPSYVDFKSVIAKIKNI